MACSPLACRPSKRSRLIHGSRRCLPTSGSERMREWTNAGGKLGSKSSMNHTLQHVWFLTNKGSSASVQGLPPQRNCQLASSNSAMYLCFTDAVVFICGGNLRLAETMLSQGKLP
eukprot:5535871-Pyramimonas_sp.AAC.2